MCKGCWVGYGAPVINIPEVLATAELIRRLYEDHRQYTGGPLHVLLEDMNIDDEQLDGDYYSSGQYAQRATFEGIPDGTGRWVHHDELKCTPEVKDLCELILAAFLRMPVSHRAAAIGWYQGWPAEYVREDLAVQLADGSLRLADSVVDEFIAELTAEPTAAGSCVPVPCPPLTEAHLVVMDEGQGPS